MYQPSNMFAIFAKYFVFLFIFEAFIAFVLFQAPFKLAPWLVTSTVSAVLLALMNRPHTVNLMFKNRELFVNELKTILLPRYNIVDQTDQYIFFRPVSYLAVLAEPIIVKFHDDKANLAGSYNMVAGLQKKLMNTGVIY